jgi:hypothetical protein
LETFHLATNFVIAKVEIGEEIPSQIALIVAQPGSSNTSALDLSEALQAGPNVDRHAYLESMNKRLEALKARREDRDEWQKATWIPFTDSLPIDLGPGDGARTIWIGAKWGGGGMEHASGTQVHIDHVPPLIVITNPVNLVTSQPMIQLQGYSDEPLQSIRYDLANATRQITNEQGFVNHQEFDPITSEIRTNYFSCVDLDLVLGTNLLILRCQDLAGNIATNTLIYVFTLENDRTPPLFTLDYPRTGDQISGDTFTARGQLDDFTAKMIAVVAANGKTNMIEGVVEREGYFWVEDMPLGGGTNYLLLTATDAAGNSSSSNVFVIKSEELLTIDIGAIPPAQLWRPTVTVTGKVSPSDQDVWVNGVQAAVLADGSWIAEKVPVISPTDGTTVFNATAIPKNARQQIAAGGSKTPAPAPKPRPLVAVQTTLNTNAITLNATQPACATFSLHLTGTEGRSFILLASTNLTTWTPILTNLNSGVTFDYTGTNVAGYICRFFRVVPVP